MINSEKITPGRLEQVKSFGKRGLAIAGLAIASFLNISMDFNHDKTLAVQSAGKPDEFVFDSQLKLMSFNTHGDKDVLRRFSKVYKNEGVDVGCLQEVLEEDIEAVKKDYPNSAIIFFGGDRPTGMFKGYFGNVIISRTSPAQNTGQRIDGWIETDQILDQGFKARKESRVVSASDFALDLGGYSLRSVRVISTHVANKKKQFRDVGNFVKDMTRDDMITIFCADLNVEPDYIEKSGFFKTSNGWVVPITGKTSGDHQIDYTMYNFGDQEPAAKSYVYEAKVRSRPDLDILGSDHFPVELTISQKLNETIN